MNLNAWAYVAIAAIFVGYTYWVYDMGHSSCLAAQAIAEKTQLKEDAKTVDKIREKEKKRAKIISTLKAKLRKTAKANKGCYRLDDPLPADFVNELRDAYNAITRPPAN